MSTVRRRGRLWSGTALLLAVALLLGGCLSLPTDGAVRDGVDVAPPDGGLELFAPGPANDATPQEIVAGFLVAAGSGLSDEFGRAREFLTTAGGAAWDPLGGVTIYSDPGSLQVTIGPTEGDGERVNVTVTVPVTATLDSRGSYSEATPGPPQDFTFQLVQIVDDQWRISQLDPGVLMSLVTFGQLYREGSVYFLSTDDATRLVPDARWVPRSGSVNEVVEALLAGPSDWLSDGVVSAFPDGTELDLDRVELNDRVATVSLTPVLLDASGSQRALALAQLQATLGQLQQIARVEMSVDGNVLAVEESLATVSATPVPARNPTVLTPDGLATVTADGLTLTPGATPLEEGIGQIALPYGDGPAVGLADSSVVLALPTAGSEEVRLYDPGTRLLDPSYDVHGWVWTGGTGPGSNTGSLTALNPVSGATIDVATPDLVGADIVAIRVSREGARLAYVVRTDDTVHTYVAAIQRDADGTPVTVSTGVPVGLPMTVARDLVWVDDTQLAVLASNDGPLTVTLIGVGGQTAALPVVEDAVAIAAGDGGRELYLVTEAGELYGRSGTGWRLVRPGVSDPTFAG